MINNLHNKTQRSHHATHEIIISPLIKNPNIFLIFISVNCDPHFLVPLFHGVWFFYFVNALKYSLNSESVFFRIVNAAYFLEIVIASLWDVICSEKILYLRMTRVWWYDTHILTQYIGFTLAMTLINFEIVLLILVLIIIGLKCLSILKAYMIPKVM